MPLHYLGNLNKSTLLLSLCVSVMISLLNTGAVPMYDAFFGAGDGPIFASSVTCFGTEDSILHCGFSPDVDDRTHADDAGVRCFPRGL